MSRYVHTYLRYKRLWNGQQASWRLLRHIIPCKWTWFKDAQSPAIQHSWLVSSAFLHTTYVVDVPFESDCLLSNIEVAQYTPVWNAVRKQCTVGEQSRLKPCTTTSQTLWCAILILCFVALNQKLFSPAKFLTSLWLFVRLTAFSFLTMTMCSIILLLQSLPASSGYTQGPIYHKLAPVGKSKGTAGIPWWACLSVLSFLCTFAASIIDDLYFHVHCCPCYDFKTSCMEFNLSFAEKMKINTPN